MRDLQVDPIKNTCCFGAGLQGWAFTIHDFAALYMKKYGGEEAYWMKMLWGDHFYNKAKNVWTNKSRNDDGTDNVRGFAGYVM